MAPRRSARSPSVNFRTPLTQSDAIYNTPASQQIGTDRVTRSRSKATPWKPEVGKENQSDAGSNSSRASSGIGSMALVPYIAQNGGSSGKASKSDTIRSPNHWTKFPKLIHGAVEEVTRVIHNSDLREKVSATLVEVMNNKNSLCGAFRNQFGADKKNTSTPRTYLTKARVLLTDLLGFNELTYGLDQKISEETSFQELLALQNDHADSNNNRNKNTNKPPTRQRGSTSGSATIGRKSSVNGSAGFSVQGVINSYKQPVNNESDFNDFKTPTLPLKRQSSYAVQEDSGTKQSRFQLDRSISLSPFGSIQNGSIIPNTAEPTTSQDHNSMVIMKPLFNLGDPTPLYTAPVRTRQPFCGTEEQFKVKIREILIGNYAGDIEPMVEMLAEGIVKEHRFAKQLKERSIPFDLLVSIFNFCSRFIAFEAVEIVNEGDE